MEKPPISYSRAFFRSPHHAWLAALTVGVGFATGEPLGLIAGVTLYTIGWIYLPGLPFFQKWADQQRHTAEQRDQLIRYAAFQKRRQAILDSLTPSNLQRYRELAEVCRTIEELSRQAFTLESNAFETPPPTLRSLDELMWTTLRLLAIEDSLEQHLEVERRENVPQLLASARAEYENLREELAQLRQQGRATEAAGREPLLDSRRELAEILRKRLDRIQQTQQHLELVRSELQRLEQQVRLLRTEAVATKNAAAIISRIDGTLAQLNQTNRWLSEFEDFKDLLTDLPRSGPRVGYGAVEPQAQQEAGPTTVTSAKTGAPEQRLQNS